MKTEFIDVNDTRKNLVVEIPSTVVDAEIDKVARDYSRAARVPGFRPGKVPAKVVRQRFRDQILHDVAHGLIPRAVDEALRERGVEPVDTPDIKDVVVEEGQPLKFTATFETVPAIEPGDYASLTLRRPAVRVEETAVEEALERLRERAARFEPVEDRGIGVGDSVLLDLRRTATAPVERAESLIVIPGEPAPPPPAPREQTDTHSNITVDIGAPANPPGFDQELSGMTPGETKTFDVTYPANYAVTELAGTTVNYDVTIKAVRTRHVPDLDDEFAKDLGEFDSLEALRRRVREDLEHEASHQVDREMRAELLKQLAARVRFEVPASLLDREIDRRVEEFVRRLMEQQIDPMKTNINWEEFREHQKEAASEAVRGALVLDEVARREQLAATEAEFEAEVGRYAERTGRTAAAVRARLEKEGGLGRLYSGLRREKTVDFLLSKATVLPI
ncbi:MAG: trigger factor [Acidobacteria bacterium]|nr:trigger factor [Acidobacteriota bacterium]MCA1651065.1 trigger factor [Acidobacteriota bacterium]